MANGRRGRLMEGGLRSDRFDGGRAIASRLQSLVLLHITFTPLNITCSDSQAIDSTESHIEVSIDVHSSSQLIITHNSPFVQRSTPLQRSRPSTISITHLPRLQQHLQRLNLLHHPSPRRPPFRRPPLHRSLIIKTPPHITLKPLIHTLQLRHRQLIHALPLLFGERHHPPADMVRFAEGHAFADEVVGEFGGEHGGFERVGHGGGGGG